MIDLQMKYFIASPEHTQYYISNNVNAPGKQTAGARVLGSGACKQGVLLLATLWTPVMQTTRKKM